MTVEKPERKPRKNKYTSHACTNCQKKKVRCINHNQYDKPCERCQREGTKCVYLPKRERGRKKKNPQQQIVKTSPTLKRKRDDSSTILPSQGTKLFDTRSTTTPSLSSSNLYGSPLGFSRESLQPVAGNEIVLYSGDHAPVARKSPFDRSTNSFGSIPDGSTRSTQLNQTIYRHPTDGDKIFTRRKAFGETINPISIPQDDTNDAQADDIQTPLLAGGEQMDISPSSYFKPTDQFEQSFSNGAAEQSPWANEFLAIEDTTSKLPPLGSTENNAYISNHTDMPLGYSDVDPVLPEKDQFEQMVESTTPTTTIQNSSNGIKLDEPTEFPNQSEIVDLDLSRTNQDTDIVDLDLSWAPKNNLRDDPSSSQKPTSEEGKRLLEYLDRNGFRPNNGRFIFDRPSSKNRRNQNNSNAMAIPSSLLSKNLPALIDSAQTGVLSKLDEKINNLGTPEQKLHAIMLVQSLAEELDKLTLAHSSGVGELTTDYNGSENPQNAMFESESDDSPSGENTM